MVKVEVEVSESDSESDLDLGLDTISYTEELDLIRTSILGRDSWNWLIDKLGESE